MLEFDAKVSLKEVFLLVTLVATVVTFKVRVEDRLDGIEKHIDEIERHLEFDDQRLNKTNDEINVLERRIDYYAGRSGVKLDMLRRNNYAPHADGSVHDVRAGKIPPGWQGPFAGQGLHSRRSGD